MSIWSRMKAGWNSMSTVDKIKTALDIVANIGCAFAANEAADFCCCGKSPIKQVAIRVGIGGLGIAAGVASAKAIDDTVDAYATMYDMIKTGDKKEEQHNA